MAKVQEYYTIGDRNNLSIERLLEIIEDMYKDLAVAVNKKADVNFTDEDGQTSDAFLSNGTINVNQNTQKVEMLTSRPTANTVSWTTLS